MQSRVTSERNLSRKNAKKMRKFSFVFRKNCFCETLSVVLLRQKACVLCSSHHYKFYYIIINNFSSVLFSQNVHIFFSRNFRLCVFAKIFHLFARHIKAIIWEKSEHSRILSRKWNAKKWNFFSKNKFFTKNANLWRITI